MKKLSFALCLLLILAPHAMAHAFLTDSSPKANSVMSELPSDVWVEFDGTLQQFENVPVNKLMITDENGNRLDDGEFKVGGARVGVHIVKKASGTITFSYRVVSEDGHPVEGKFAVTVNSTATAPAVTEDQKTSTTNASAKVASSSTKNVSTPLPKPSQIVHHGFFEHHAVHISEGLIAFFLILGWAFYRKYK